MIMAESEGMLVMTTEGMVMNMMTRGGDEEDGDEMDDDDGD